MRKQFKMFVSAVLALSMVMGMTSCGTAENGAQTTGASGGKDEVVTLKMFIRNQSKYAGIQEDPVAKYIEEKFGIKIELTVDSSLGTTSAQASTFNELLASKLASNSLDDIMDFGSSAGNAEVVSSLKRAAEAGMIIPLDDLVKNTEHLNSDPRLVLRNDYRRENMYTDGKFYSLGGWGGMGLDQNPGAAPWVRWDLYKAMGYPDIKTDDELLAMLETMQNDAPATPSGNKVYAFGGFWADAQGIGDGFINRDYPLNKGYESLEGNYAAYFNHATREVEDLLSNPNSALWNGIEFYNKANRKGLIDPGASMMSKAEYDDKVKSANYLCSLNGWELSNKEQLFESLGIPNSGYMPIRPLEDVQSLSLYWESVLGGNEFAITKNCKYPEKAIEFLDWCMSEEGSRIITQGAEGLAYTMDGDKPVLTEQFKKDNAAGNVDMAEVYGKWKYAGINAFQHIDLDKNGIYIQPEQIPDPSTYSAVKKDALSFYGAENFNDYWTTYTNRAGEKIPNVLWGSYASAIGEKPDDIKQKYGQINDYMYRSIFPMILAKTPEEFETLKTTAIAEVKKLGLADVVTWYQNRFKEIHTSLDPIIDKAMPAYRVK